MLASANYRWILVANLKKQHRTQKVVLIIINMFPCKTHVLHQFWHSYEQNTKEKTPAKTTKKHQNPIILAHFANHCVVFCLYHVYFINSKALFLLHSKMVCQSEDDSLLPWSNSACISSFGAVNVLVLIIPKLLIFI